jgi:hypothetical protein
MMTGNTSAFDFPPPTAREAIHTRSVVTRCYLHADGCWDFEGKIVDSRTWGSVNGDGRRAGPGDPFITCESASASTIHSR